MDNKSFKLPDFFGSKISKTSHNKTTDRIRNKPHVPGNWPTLIYIPINVADENGLLEMIKSRVKSEAPEMKLVDPIMKDSCRFHLSLSRNLYIKHYEKDLFIEKITKALSQVLKSFPLKEAAVEYEQGNQIISVYHNDEKNRSFLAVNFKENLSISKYIEAVDSVLNQFSLPQYYQPASLHFSCLWCSGHCEDLLENGSIDNYFENFGLSVQIEEINVKIGNKVIKFK